MSEWLTIQLAATAVAAVSTFVAWRLAVGSKRRLAEWRRLRAEALQAVSRETRAPKKQLVTVRLNDVALVQFQVEGEVTPIGGDAQTFRRAMAGARWPLKLDIDVKEFRREGGE